VRSPGFNPQPLHKKKKKKPICSYCHYINLESDMNSVPDFSLYSTIFYSGNLFNLGMFSLCKEKLMRVLPNRVSLALN
jgi:hypothetical protein